MALNLSQKPAYLLLCLQCWLKVVLDCLIALIAVSLIAVTVEYRNTTTGADIGLALNLIIVANSTLLKLVQSWASLETSLGAVTRLKSVQDSVPVEDGVNVSDPGPRWPLSGETLVDNISVSYSSSPGLALRDMSLRIIGGQKVIIMGRTGRYVRKFRPRRFHTDQLLSCVVERAHSCFLCLSFSPPRKER